MPITRLPTSDELQKIAAAGGNPQQYANTPLTFLTPEEQAASQGQQQSPGIVGTIGEHAAAGVAPGAAFMAAAPSGAKVGALIGAAIPGVGETGISEGIGAAAGGLISGSLASWAAYKAQHAILNKVAPDFTAKMDSALQQGADEHPIAAVAGDVLGNWPSAKAELPKLAQLPFRAAVGGGIGVAMPLLEGRAPNWQDVVSGAANASIFGRSRFGGEPAPEVTNGNENSGEQKPEEPVGEMTTRFTNVDENGDYTIGSSALKPLYMKQFAEKVKGITDPILKAEAQTRNEKLSNLSPSDMRQQLHVAAMAEKAKSIVGADDLDAGLRNAEDTTDVNLPWQEPRPEVTNASKPVVKDASIEETPTSKASPAPQASANTQDFLKAKMEDLQQSGIGSKVTEPPVLPKVNPVVEEAKAREQAARQDNSGPQTEAERIQEQFDKQNTRNAPPSEDSTKPKFIGTQKGAGNIPDTDYYNLVRPITDSNSKVLHDAGSTVSEHTLRKYGVDFDEKGVTNNDFVKGKINPTQRTLAEAVDKGSQKDAKPVTLGDALQFLISRNHPLSSVFRSMLATRNADLTTPIIHDPNIDPRVNSGEHRPNNDGGVGVIALPTAHLHDIDSILHEGIHALEHRVLPTAPEGVTGMAYLDFLQKFIENKESNPHAVEMVKTYLESARQKGLMNTLFGKNGTAGEYSLAGTRTKEKGANYGYGNVHEFSADKFDPDFQQTLRQQKWGDTNLWERIKQTLRRFLGNPDKTMFDRMMEASKKVQKASGKSTEEYNTRGSKGDRTNRFLTNGAELVKDPIKLGLRPNTSGAYNGTQLLGTLMNKLSPMEQEIYKSQGIEQYFSGRTISQADAVKWMEEHSLKAETHTYGMEGKVSEAKKEYDKMTHEWLDTKDGNTRNAILRAVDMLETDRHEQANQHLAKLSDEDIDKTRKYAQMRQIIEAEPADKSLKATAYYSSSVSAFPTDEPMPDWTATKSRKNVQRVDVVIPQKMSEMTELQKKNSPTLYKSSGGKVPETIWEQDNLHENLPNTLGWAMIQYKTGPKGEKIAVIAEAQSRWGQSNKKIKDNLKNDVNLNAAQETLDKAARGEINLDAHTKQRLEQLLSKRVSDIDHPLLRDYNRLILKAAIDQARKEGATHIMVSDGETAMMTEEHDNLAGRTQPPYNKIPQEPGMRLNYDTILPKIAEELTGSKGERVSLGEHKNAYDSNGNKRNNLIFGEGKKSDVSGRMYKLDSVPDREPMLYGKRYAMPKPPEGQSHTPEELSLPKDKYMGKFGATFRSVIDKVRDIGTPVARYSADAGQRTKDQEDNLKGKWKNPVVQAGLKVSLANRIKIGEVMRRERLDDKLYPTAIPSDVASRRFYRLYRDKLTEAGMHQLAIGEPITEAHTVGNKTIYTKRNIKMNDTYAPDMEKSHITQVIKENKDQPAIEKILQTFHDFNTKTLGLSEQESAKRIANWKVSLQGNNNGHDVSHQDIFNARRKAAGQQLPPEFIENDPVRSAERYFDRAAIDASHYEFMEKDHKVLAALGQMKDAWGKDVKQLPNGGYGNNASVKAMLDAWREQARNPADQNESSLSSLISSAFIAGPALELHKVVSNTVMTLSLAPNPLVALKAVTHAFMNVREGYQHAVEGNVYHPTARSWRMMIDGTTTAAEKMQGLARIIRQVSTLGDYTTKVSAGLVQGMNEVIIPSKIARAQAGDITQQKFLRNLDPSFDPHKNYSPEEIQQLASRSANYIHGTGDIRSMPAWMLNDSEFSGFFSLAHWSIAQTNNFMKNVYEPALRGDIKPLLTGVFGAAIGGYLIKELRQDIQGKKSPIPSLTEIASSDKGLEGNKGLVAYNMIAAMQFAGFGGLLSQLAKYPFDAAYKNNPQGATFPMDEVASDLATTLHQVSTAIANDPNVNWVDLAKAVTMHSLSTNFQLSRIAINQGINHGLITGLPAEKKELSDKMGQLRRFDMVEGLPYNEIDEASNPYMNLEQKSFKMEQDPQKAMQQLPSLVQNIMETYHDKPDVMMSKLKSLKENQYSTFPSMENMPLSFMKYVGYLQRMEGPEAAQQELQDFMKHKVVNESKASVIP